MSNLKIARRYAKSLLETAIEQQLDDVVARDLAAIQTLGASSADFRAMMRSPIIDAHIKISVLAEALGAEINPLTLEFLKLIINKGRGNIWREIVMEYRMLLDNRKNIVRIRVTSAVALGEQERSHIETALSTRLARTVMAIYDTDPAILGGAVIRVGDEVLDGSIRHQLHVLKDKLAVA